MSDEKREMRDERTEISNQRKEMEDENTRLREELERVKRQKLPEWSQEEVINHEDVKRSTMELLGKLGLQDDGAANDHVGEFLSTFGKAVRTKMHGTAPF